MLEKFLNTILCSLQKEVFFLSDDSENLSKFKLLTLNLVIDVDLVIDIVFDICLTNFHSSEEYSKICCSLMYYLN